MYNRFGTTSEMVIQTVEENGLPLVLAIDAKGLFLTTKDRLDSLFADTNRYAAARESVALRLEKIGLDPLDLASKNQHRIKQAAGDSGKKVNPLKASKRGAKGK